MNYYSATEVFEVAVLISRWIGGYQNNLPWTEYEKPSFSLRPLKNRRSLIFHLPVSFREQSKSTTLNWEKEGVKKTAMDAQGSVCLSNAGALQLRCLQIKENCGASSWLYISARSYLRIPFKYILRWKTPDCRGSEKPQAQPNHLLAREG